MKTQNTNNKSYSELILLKTFIERYEYLKLNGSVGISTFGYDRYLNQRLYTSKKWRSFRNDIIIRDNGCDLGVDDYIIYKRAIIHHIVPITIEDIKQNNYNIFNPDNVITTTHNTHMAIHYGDYNMLITDPTIRSPNDTKLWR